VFPSSKYSENVYLELLDRGPELSDEGIEILGAWKDAALKSTSLQNPSGHLFGRVRVLFNGKWNPGTSCAYSSWQQIPSRLPTLKQQLDRQEYSRFLTDLAEMQYEKTARGGHLMASIAANESTRANIRNRPGIWRISSLSFVKLHQCATRPMISGAYEMSIRPCSPTENYSNNHD
jgi:hypothetical protein